MPQAIDIETNRPVNILLLEDDDGHAKAFTRAFKKAEIANPITRVVDGVEAFEKLRGENTESLQEPYVIISDINMPRMDGIEFIKKLREDPELQNAVVFMLSTSNSSFDITLSYMHNVAGYICKDSVGEDFIHLVNLMKNYWRIVDLPQH